MLPINPYIYHIYRSKDQMTNHRHFILNKPYGYISQFVDNSCERKGLLGELYDFPEGAMAIGRLDKDSEGLLFITTDGKLSNYIRSKHIDKEYYASVEGVIDGPTIEQLRNGVEIYTKGEYFMTSPCVVERLAIPPYDISRVKKRRSDRPGISSWISITLREGRNRQVRKMTGVVRFPTLRLVRVRIGTIDLGNMKPGEVIEVSGFGEEITEGYEGLKGRKVGR